MTTWTYVVAPAADPGAAAAGDVYPLAPQSNHKGYAQAVLLEQFHAMPRMEDMTGDLAGMCQSLEDVCWQLLRERYLYPVDGYGPAEGQQLDDLGELLGEPRAGRGDDAYRLFLAVRILINVSDGYTEDLLGILDLLTTGFRRVLEVPPAHDEIWIYESIYVVDAWRALKQAKSGGVGITLIYSSQADGKVFKWSSQSGVETPNAGDEGWADASASWSGGGMWAGGLK
jgi:hypothetical protein